jgi:hypothetical protein
MRTMRTVRVLICLMAGACLANGGCGKTASDPRADAAAKTGASSGVGGSLGGSAGSAAGGAGGIAPGRGGAAGLANLGSGGSGGAPSTGGVGAGGLAAGGVGGKGSGGVGVGGANIIDASTGDAVPIIDAFSDAFSSIDGPVACNQLTTQAACEARSDCYGVFVDPNTCGCAAAGCCARFNHCAAGTPMCNGGVSCTTATPYCSGPYVVSYASGCYQGCVRQTACGQYATACPQSAPADGDACRGNGAMCVYQNCAGAGRTEATCSASGTWKVATMACDAVKCVGAGTTGGSLVCETGQVCVLTTGGGGAYSVTPACLPNKCSPAALSLDCMGLGSNCFVDSDHAISCRQPSSCGSGQGGCQ